MNPLIEVEKLGQSIWYDNIRRALIDSGELAQKIGALPAGVTSTLGKKVEGDDLRGVTSNPTIFEHAISGSADYVAQIAALRAAGVTDPKAIYERLAIADIRPAADALRPVYDESGGRDG